MRKLSLIIIIALCVFYSCSDRDHSFLKKDWELKDIGLLSTNKDTSKYMAGIVYAMAAIGMKESKIIFKFNNENNKYTLLNNDKIYEKGQYIFDPVVNKIYMYSDTDKILFSISKISNDSIRLIAEPDSVEYLLVAI